MNIGIIGIGFVGSAIMNSLIGKNYILNETLFVYDKYKNEYNNNFDKLFTCEIIFLTLPTLYNFDECSYDMEPIIDTLDKLTKYTGIIILKSTVEPNTTKNLFNKYNLKILHNPEFLTARTALQDFNNQQHIILGLVDNCVYDNVVYDFYKHNFPNADISTCSSTESETIKLFLNSFYAVKVQIFTEMYMLCNKLEIDYDNVIKIMLKNNWINPMHTTIPGPDGNVSYGGMCFPKDTNALCNVMDKYDSPNAVLKATIDERNTMRQN